MKIKKNTLIRSYALSMGMEAATDLITEKINSAALEEKELYTEEETAKIYGELIKEGGLIGIVAQNLVVQLERKRSEEQTLLLDNIEHQIWYLTDKETYGVVNKAHAKFLGLEKEELEEKDLYDIIGVEEADICIANNREVFEKKKQSHIEEWIKNVRGETRLLSITRTPKIDENGNVEYVICAAEDITERKKAEEKIKEADIIINKSPAVAFTWKNEEGWPVKYISENVKKLFGYSSEDFLSRKISYAECIYPDDLERVEQEIADFSDEEEIDEFVHKPYRILTKDNNVKIVKNWIFIVRDFEGKITHYKGIIEDITERKRVDEALLKSEEKFRLLAENSVDCIWMLDKKLKFTYLSPSTERILGYKPEQMIGTNLSSHFKKKEFLKIGALAANAIKNYETFTHYTFETKMLNSKNDEVDIEITSRLLLNNQGKLIGLQGLTRDITERKQAEEVLRESEEKFRKLTEHLPVAIAVVDKNEKTEYANRKYFETIGNIYETPNLADWFLCVYPDEEYRKYVIEKWYVDIEKSIKEGKEVEPFEYNITCKDGKVRVMEISGTWIGDKFVTIFNDVTERVHAEAELQKLNEKLEQRVNERTAELEKQNEDLESMNKAFVGREIRMIELKGIIKDLEEQIASVENEGE
ncbi:MAG: PAS domain S-box protein [Methanosarcinales archaeon]|nr:PAS domain S-box protein [Methanosarcinales archaeon]